MFAIIGFIVVFASIIVGFTMHGGKIPALLQINEFIILGGAGVGSILVGYGMNGLKTAIKAATGIMKGNVYTKPVYTELLIAMYEMFTLAKREGPLALEGHVENPEKSDILSKYPFFLGNHHAMNLYADTMKLIIMGGINTYDLSDLMELDMEAMHEEAMEASNIFTTIGDSMPGFGIVAAVLGVVITMQSIGGKPEEIGEKVAAALVGTFLGILMAYGMFAPLAKLEEKKVKCEEQYLSCIKHGVVAFARGDAPLTCVEFARRNIEPECRPSFSEIENACKQRGKANVDNDMAQAA